MTSVIGRKVLLVIAVDYRGVVYVEAILKERCVSIQPKVEEIIKDLAKHDPYVPPPVRKRMSRRGQMKATNARIYVNKSLPLGRRTGIRKKG